MRARRAPSLLAVLAAGAIWAPAAQAERGVALDAGRIVITQRLAPGDSYLLPALAVRNPGTERTRYRLTVSYLERQRARRPPQAWFRFSPRLLTLNPHESRPVAIRLTLPHDTKPGGYEALVGAQIAFHSGGPHVGAAAAAPLTFTVASEDLGARVWSRLATLSSSPWTYAAAGLALLALASARAIRRFRIQITRRT